MGLAFWSSDEDEDNLPLLFIYFLGLAESDEEVDWFLPLFYNWELFFGYFLGSDELSEDDFTNYFFFGAFFAYPDESDDEELLFLSSVNLFPTFFFEDYDIFDGTFLPLSLSLELEGKTLDLATALTGAALSLEDESIATALFLTTT